MPASFLGLSGWSVESVTETSDATYAVQAAFGQQPFSCPKCGVVSEFYKHGTLLQRVNDTTHAGKPVVILWDRQRYRCRACSATFLQPSTDIDDNQDDGLARSWAGHRVFCNPPYGNGIGDWLAKAREADVAVFLIPSRTDTAWWHEHVLAADEIRFIRGRLKFAGAKYNAPFPSAIIVYRSAT